MNIILNESDQDFLIKNCAIVAEEGKLIFALPVLKKIFSSENETPDTIFKMSDDVVENANNYIKHTVANKGGISDGYHTFDELYDHRCVLYILVCKREKMYKVWRSKTHSDGSVWDGWFILGLGKDVGFQITYHLPEKYWDAVEFAETLDKAPEFDGHTSADVLERLVSRF